jgi:hypothetical protein
MQLRPGRLLAIALVASWAALFGFHLWRSYAPSAAAARVDFSAPTAAAGLSQRGVFYRGARIGYLREKLTPLSQGFRTEQEGSFVLTVLGREREMNISGVADLDQDGRLKSFGFRLSTASERSPFETAIQGEIEGQELTLRIRSGASERTEKRRLAEPPAIPLNLYRSLAAQGLEVGKSFRVRLLDPLTLAEGEAEVEVMGLEVVHWAGREEEAFRLSQRFAGLATTAWISRAGELLKEETALGWTLLKEAPGSALAARGEAPDVVATSAIPAIGFTGEANRLHRVRLRLHRFPAEWSALEGGRQQRLEESDEVVILREIPPASVRVRLEVAEQQETLAADAFIQSDDPEIRAQADRITRGLSPREAARALTDWVYQNVRKTPTLSVPSAREVMAQRTGDCNEHTVLFAALARAAGLPTRMATGLAWSAGQFYYHAWPEVWLDQWLAVDPTFGQFPADPLHLRLASGGLEKQFEILALMGRGAYVEILEAR